MPPSLDADERTTLRRDEIGFVYQFHHLLPDFSALENVVMPQLVAGHTASRSRERARGTARRARAWANG